MRFTKTWSPISRVFSIELDGISNACTTNVMMNNPVTSTAASDARNSTVVSLGFSSASLSFDFSAADSFAFATATLFSTFDSFFATFSSVSAVTPPLALVP